MKSSIRQSAVMGTGKASAPEQNPQTLLRAAGIEAMQARAAYIEPMTETEFPEFAPEDEQQICAPEAAMQLAWLMERRQPALQDLWVEKLQAANLSLPYEWIVPLLERGAKAGAYGDDNLGLLAGRRGKWLAEISQEAKWKWVFKENPRKHHKTKHNIHHASIKKLIDDLDELLPEKIEKSQQGFYELRKQNPEIGRLWLLRYWEDLRGADRWQYLELLRNGLSRKDEIWLMNIAAGLEEKEGDLVHEAQIALQLLSLLNEQVLVQNLTQKVFSTLHLSQENGLLLDFIWSVSYEGEMVYKAHIGLNKLMDIFNWRLSLDAILKLIPMQAWTAHFKVNAADLMQAAAKSSHAGVFAEAWAKRIHYEINLDFAMAWLGQFPPDLATANQIHKESDDYTLLELLNWEQLVVVLARYIK